MSGLTIYYEKDGRRLQHKRRSAPTENDALIQLEPTFFDLNQYTHTPPWIFQKNINLNLNRHHSQTFMARNGVPIICASSGRMLHHSARRAQRRATSATTTHDRLRRRAAPAWIKFSKMSIFSSSCIPIHGDFTYPILIPTGQSIPLFPFWRVDSFKWLFIFATQESQQVDPFTSD
jgi:hypothetical protein